MQPRAAARVAKKIATQGAVIKKKVASAPFSRDELVELGRLSALLPPSPVNSDPTALLFNAAGYIQQLLATIHARVQNGTLPQEVLAALPPMPTKPASSSRTAPKKKRRSIEKKY